MTPATNLLIALRLATELAIQPHVVIPTAPMPWL